MTWSFRKSVSQTALCLAIGTIGAMAFQAKDAAAQVSDTGMLTVSVNVQQTCAVEGGSLDFGTYSSGQNATVAAIGSISYTGCAVAAVNVALDGGQAASEEPRLMTDGNGNNLQYHLFQDANRSEFWGTGEKSQDLDVAEGGSGTWPVYGRIIREQSVPAGSYSDQVNITLTF